MTRSGRGSTRTGVGAAIPSQPYQPPARVHHDGADLVVRFTGEDQRSMQLRVNMLPLPGWHQSLAGALAMRCGPAGARRTKASVENTWATVGRLIRFLATQLRPPATPQQLTAAHVEAFHRHIAATGARYADREMREAGRVLRTPPLCDLVTPEALDYANQRIQQQPARPTPGYTDRELGALLRAARRDVEHTRDRIRRSEITLSLLGRQEDPSDSGRENDNDLLTLMARTGTAGLA